MHNHPPVDAQRIELHIRELEARLELLSTSFMADMSEPERMNVQRELFALQTALEHYKTALQVELSENFPPPSLD